MIVISLVDSLLIFCAQQANSLTLGASQSPKFKGNLLNNVSRFVWKLIDIN